MFSVAQEKLYGGAAGGGKSHLLRVRLIYLALAVAGLQGFLFRRIFPDLITNHMRGPRSFPVLLADMVSARLCRITYKTIIFYNGSRINLCHCQYEKNVYQYQGAEIHALAIDELTHFKESMYRFLRGRCRVPGLIIPQGITLPDITCSANPGGEGHVWVKKSFVDLGPNVPTTMPMKEGGMVREYIPALAEDNPRLLLDDPTYLDRLSGLGDPVLVKAMRLGDWNIAAGAKFQAFTRERHVRKAFAIPESWDLWRSGDDGFGSPMACYWFTQDPDTKTYYVLGELYGEKIRPEKAAEYIRDGDFSLVMLTSDGEEEHNTDRLTGYYDSSAFSDRGDGGDAIARGVQMNRLGCRWVPVPKWPGSKKARVQLLGQLLEPNPKDPKGGPGIVFFDTCVNAIETIPTLLTDPRDPENVDPNGNDHAFDGVTYGLQWRKSGFRKAKVTGL
jgi:hypothetical protein